MKRWCLMAALLLLTVLGALLITQKQAYAATSFYCAQGKAHGYFTSKYSADGDGSDLAKSVCARWNVLPQPALMNINKVNGAADFIAIVNGALNSGNKYQQIAGAFIVDSMLGYKNALHGNPAGGGTAAGITYARNNWNSWVALVNSYEAANGDPNSPYKVYWNYNVSKQEFCGDGTNPDSGYDWNIQDAVFYYLPAWWTSGCDIYPTGNVVVRFQWPGGKFDIDKPCGNLSGALDKIPVAPQNHKPTGTLALNCSPVVAQWTATVSISDPDAATTGKVTVVGTLWQAPVSSGSTVTIPIPTSDAPPDSVVTVQLYANDTGPAANGQSVLVASADTGACVSYSCGNLSTTPAIVDPYMRFSITVNVQSSGAAPTGNVAITVSPRAPNVFSFNGSSAATTSGSTARATFANLGPTSGVGDKTGGRYDVAWSIGSTACKGVLDIVNLPYVNVYGGDAMAGASPEYTGSSSQCAVDPNGDYGGLYSWNNVSASYAGAGAQFAVQALGAITGFASALQSSNTKPDGLSFANTFASGGASKDNPSQGLYGGYFGDPSGSWSGSCDFTSDIKQAPTVGNVTINATSVGLGTNTVKYIHGDVYILGDITYAGAGGWGSVSQIPSFKLVVVGGNIYINSAVKQLDGLYVAEPFNGIGGKIYTCSSGGNPVGPTTANYFNICHNQLVINGAFVAGQVQFGRTYGTLGQAGSDTSSSNHDAEVFHYSPELWLPRNSSPPGTGYAAITGLPPVL